MNNKKLALLYANPSDAELWKKPLDEAGFSNVDYIDMGAANWYGRCIEAKADLFILRPPGLTNWQKSMFDERVRILADKVDASFYPSILECELYENKKNLSYWLEAQGIPHPQTRVFYAKDEALQFLSKQSYPVVAKMNIGASGKGVRVLKNMKEASSYVDTVFTKGVRPYVGPSLSHGNIWSKAKNVMKKKGLLQKRLSGYRAILGETQKFCIFQEFIEHSFEWRVVCIGESFFAHKKMMHKGKASGSLVKGYSNPPLDLFDFVRDLCQKHGLSSASIDLFERGEEYLVNEIQCFFGQSDPYQMKVDDIVGRYVYDQGWRFEAGDFARDQCYPLRVEHILAILNKKP